MRREGPARGVYDPAAAMKGGSSGRRSEHRGASARGARVRASRGSLSALGLALFVGGATGCNTRVRQCNALIDAVNAEQDGVVRALNQVGTPPEPAPLEALAHSFDNAVQRVSAVPLEDATLRAQAVTLQGTFRGFASVVTAMARAARAGAAAQYNEERRALNGLNNDLGAAVDSVNAYCKR